MVKIFNTDSIFEFQMNSINGLNSNIQKLNDKLDQTNYQLDEYKQQTNKQLDEYKQQTSKLVKQIMDKDEFENKINLRRLTEQFIKKVESQNYFLKGGFQVFEFIKSNPDEF